MSDLTTIVAEFQAISDTFRKTIQDKMKVAFTEFFVQNPEFRSIEWVQYTPYFNDGESCEFNVHDFWYTLQPEFYADEETRGMIEEGDYSARDLEEYDVIKVPDESNRGGRWYKSMFEEWDALPGETRAEYTRLYTIWTKMRTALEGIPEDVFLATFKDHVQVQVTKDGITITEYDHD